MGGVEGGGGDKEEGEGEEVDEKWVKMRRWRK